MKTISKTNTVNFIIYIHYRDGDSEYTNKRLLQLVIPNEDFSMRDRISEYLGFPADAYDHDDNGWWDGNRLFDFEFRVVPDNHYDILRRYI